MGVQSGGGVQSGASTLYISRTVEWKGDWDYWVYTQSLGRIRVARSRSSGFIDVWVWVYGIPTDLSVGGDNAASAYVLCPL